jgi:hypothetical protein
MLCAADNNNNDDNNTGPFDSIDANPGALNPGWLKIINGSDLFLLTYVVNIKIP